MNLLILKDRDASAIAMIINAYEVIRVRLVIFQNCSKQQLADFLGAPKDTIITLAAPNTLLAF